MANTSYGNNFTLLINTAQRPVAVLTTRRGAALRQRGRMQRQRLNTTFPKDSTLNQGRYRIDRELNRELP